jgi:hypothetical protein
MRTRRDASQAIGDNYRNFLTDDEEIMYVHAEMAQSLAAYMRG